MDLKITCKHISLGFQFLRYLILNYQILAKQNPNFVFLMNIFNCTQKCTSYKYVLHTKSNANEN